MYDKTLVYNTYSMYYKIIKKDINKCYFCLEDINYLMNKINATHYLNKLTVLSLTSENRLMLILFFIVLILFIIVIPCLLLDYILDKNKKFTFNSMF